MHTYTLIQWVALFYFYCFFGWCYESSYVSVKEHKWVNRGFMSGPMLPIYGTGAVMVLLAVIPFKSSAVLVYFVGAAAATVLELITGILMEAIFKVRYWDYTNQKFNFRGHICLTSTIAWGFFSVVLIYAINRPIETMVMDIPSEILTAVVFVITIAAVADFTNSFRTAIEFREVLEKIEKAKEEIRMLQKRLEVIQAILADDAEQQREQVKRLTVEKVDAFRTEIAGIIRKQEDYTSAIKERIVSSKDKLSMLRRNPGAYSEKYTVALEEFKSRLKEKWKKNESE